MTIVLHANWSRGLLHLWGESTASPESPASAATTGAANGKGIHPHAASHAELRARIASVTAGVAGSLAGGIGPDIGTPGEIPLRLPARDGIPLMSPTAAHQLGETAADEGDAAIEWVAAMTPTIGLDPLHAEAILERLVEAADEEPAEEAVDVLDTPDAADPPTTTTFRIILSDTVRFFAVAVRLARWLICEQRFVPSLLVEPLGDASGFWQPWLGDEHAASKVRQLIEAMPAAACAATDELDHQPLAIVESLLCRLIDAMCRRAFHQQELHGVIEGREPATDQHVAWLAGLLDGVAQVPVIGPTRQELVRGVRAWLSRLEDRGPQAVWRLFLRLAEPLNISGLADFQPPGDGAIWTLSFHLQSVDRPKLIVDGRDVWVLRGPAVASDGQRIEDPQELLLAGLSRAAGLFKPIERALEDQQPTEVLLSTAEAYQFLREVHPVLAEQGFGVEVPEWWFSPTARISAKLFIDSPTLDPASARAASAPSRSATHLGLGSLVNYRWQLALGDSTLTLHQFERLAAQHSPLVRVNGQWVEIRPEEVRSATEFLRANAGGQIEAARALRLAYASDQKQTGIPVTGIEATGWFAAVFGESTGGTGGSGRSVPNLETPANFHGTLRPYQAKGLSWLAFLDALSLGACLADDMGLGKTVQLLALLVHERTQAVDENGEPVAVPRPNPTLLIVPMSVLGNWMHETRRFAPSLKILLHHGLERREGEAFLQSAVDADVVVTTYALANRDRDLLALVKWGRVVLDEAQNIKNPAAKQTQAVRSIQAPSRVALTGTPVENRLGELWSIMDFLNPDFLGPQSDFRRRFAVPIERYHDRHRAAQLRGLVQPFILRRLKTDPGVIADLPEKIEAREFCYLTPEQARLYQVCVNDMLAAADRAQGMQRRGVVLAGLMKLKQICNHPAQFLKEEMSETAPDGSESGGGPRLGAVDAARSGKCFRLVEMVKEMIAGGERGLIFTQFRTMGEILAGILRHELDKEVLFLHGGSTAPQRQEMINAFQKQEAAGMDAVTASRYPVFILSLKAGGLGLNLTAATHVFHFDRWWNPAVEAQATDRAFRIGQTRTVYVHKFVVSGTLEERIDQMIEQKTELADTVIGSGEAWLTELSTTQLRDLLVLRQEAIAD